MKVLFGNRIRSVHPSVLVDVEETKEKPGVVARAKPVQRRAGSVVAIHEEVLGIELKRFKSLPTEIWNHVVASLRETLRGLADTLDVAYQEGMEDRLLELLEQKIPEKVYAFGREAMESVLNHERGSYGSRIRCDQCDGELRLQGLISRKALTRLGPVQFRRAYYHCKCGHGVSPLDELLGLTDHGILPAIQEIIAEQAAKLPYAEAVSGVQRMLPVTISLFTGEQVTMDVAQQLQEEQERERREAFGNASTAHLPKAEVIPIKRIAVMAVDGGMCRIKNQTTYSEFKVGVLGSVDPRPRKDEEPKVLDKSYVAHVTDADSIFEYLQLEYSRKGFQHCGILQFLGDGAPWIWNRVESLCRPGQTLLLTLDFYHAIEHLQQAANAIYGEGTEQGKQWVKKQCHLLKAGELRAFFQRITYQHRNATRRGRTSTVEAIVDVQRYFRERDRLLTYKKCLALGLPIGSGMVEGGVRFVGKDRIDRTGMAWTVPGVEAILQLRCLAASNRWNAFFQKQAAKRLKAFKTQKLAWLRAA